MNFQNEMVLASSIKEYDPIQWRASVIGIDGFSAKLGDPMISVNPSLRQAVEIRFAFVPGHALQMARRAAW